jgi:uncharacterized membrane protein
MEILTLVVTVTIAYNRNLVLMTVLLAIIIVGIIEFVVTLVYLDDLNKLIKQKNTIFKIIFSLIPVLFWYFSYLAFKESRQIIVDSMDDI